jgi:hypothetical protein
MSTTTPLPASIVSLLYIVKQQANRLLDVEVTIEVLVSVCLVFLVLILCYLTYIYRRLQARLSLSLPTHVSNNMRMRRR